MKQDSVDVHNDELMIALGVRNPVLVGRDQGVWNKSKKEKKALREARNLHKSKMHFNSSYSKSIPVRDKLIIQLKKNKVFPFTTYSVVCNMSDIQNILNYFGHTIVSKYYFNGKTYGPYEQPYW